MKLDPIYYWLIILAIVTLSSCSPQNKLQDKPKDSSDNFKPIKLNFGQAVRFDDPSHREAAKAIIRRHGLSSTGSIFFSGSFTVSKEINGFCEKNDKIYEYRTSHLFSRLHNVIWYNPKTKQTYILY